MSTAEGNKLIAELEQPMVIKIMKHKFDQISYYSSLDFYEWCKRNKIKCEEPINNGRYDRFIITLDTIEKLFLFSNKYLKVLKLNPDSVLNSQIKTKPHE